MNHPPLKDIRVLDLTRVLAGPWATQMLADFGAEVIKIEKPGEGDDTRGWGPPFVKNADGSEGDAAYFHSANRGKKSVCIDMAKPEGASLIKALAAQADILVENFKVGGLAKYGLDYLALSTLNPRLIYCSITGFGQDGPYANRAGYDFMIQGMAGVMSITGEPGGEPQKMGVAFSDVFAGLHAMIGIQAALYAREKTGLGQHIDISLLDSQVSVLANQAMNYLVSGKVPKRLGNAHPNIVPYQTFETADGHIIMAVGNDRQFGEYCKLIGAPHLGEDTRFTTNRGRVEHRDVLIPALRPFMKARSTAEWTQVFEAASVPCGPINTIDQVFENPQVKARGLLRELEAADGSKVPTVSGPVVFSGAERTDARPSPRLGQDTESVLKDLLNLSAEDAQGLRDKGIVS
ncbi:CaiB/BaiF CoA transferase family protein [Aestuariivirga litoralis]|uniref:CaiB/BaiF CoA transferase family protein n=1 Tax=Aestuariivirga litoralis TaxID=2650924 RepID=UPI0018C66CC1|nr:CaiB/BaiF CoA-transferase family protein [Aestuariivirga litoralis]MBG1232049.1 CoA transferase [Aestuariivirga litoralis]